MSAIFDYRSLVGALRLVFQRLGDILINHFPRFCDKNEIILDDSYMYMQLWIDSALSLQPRREKNGFLHMRKQSRRSASR